MQRKTVLITGSSRGVGRACAKKFASKDYHVFIHGKTLSSSLSSLYDEIKEMKNGDVTMLTGDISSVNDIDKMFSVINETSSGIDVLINNAGISSVGLITDMDIKDWHLLIDTNLTSAFYCTKKALPHMIHKKDGCIINISSMWGRVGASCEVAYSASKAGLQGFTKALAKELSPSNIKVNCAALGVIDTDMNSNLTKEEREILSDDIPFGRFAHPEEAAEFIYGITLLPSYMTGQIIGFDGGYI